VATLLSRKIFELHIQDWVLFPIFIVEVPLLLVIYLEILFFHDLTQKVSPSTLLWRAASVIGKGVIGSFRWHLHFLARFRIV
jgi:hypothetical protein